MITGVTVAAPLKTCGYMYAKQVMSSIKTSRREGVIQCCNLHPNVEKPTASLEGVVEAYS